MAADTVALQYQDKDVEFEKSTSLLALRARAGMADAMQEDIDLVSSGASGAGQRNIGTFDIIELISPAGGIEQVLDWLRARPSVAVATHVFHIKNDPALFVPNGNIHLVFEENVTGHRQQAILTRYRLQAIEARGGGDFLVTITTGSKNPIATAAALQKEAIITLAEPEFASAG